MALQHEPREVVRRQVGGAVGGADRVVGVGRVLEVHEVALEVPVQLPAAAELEGGVRLVEALDAGPEAEAVVVPGAVRAEEDGEVLEQRAAGAVVGQPVEEVPVHHVAAEPVHEPGLGVEPLAEPLQ